MDDSRHTRQIGQYRQAHRYASGIFRPKDLRLLSATTSPVAPLRKNRPARGRDPVIRRTRRGRVASRIASAEQSGRRGLPGPGGSARSPEITGAMTAAPGQAKLASLLNLTHDTIFARDMSD